MADFIVGLIIVLIVFFAVRYIVKEKKKGRKCIGCPYSGSANCHCK